LPEAAAAMPVVVMECVWRMARWSVVLLKEAVGIDRMITEKAANLAEDRMKAIVFSKNFYQEI
jgi:hypothetical protein